MRNFIRLNLIVFAQILLLCSCSIMQPSERSGSLPQDGSTEPASSDSGHKPATDKEFNEHHEITSTQSIEKDGLLISYNLRVIPGREGILIRLSLVFRNRQDQIRVVRPKVWLVEDSGKTISAFTQKGFIGYSSRLAGKTSAAAANSINKHDMNGKKSAKSRIQWAKTNWLKNSYKLPPQGIAIGELVFHCTQLNLPIKLTVNSNQHEFVFAIRNLPPIDDK